MKRTLLSLAVALALAGGLAACSTATPYQALNPNDVSAGGYHDVKLDDSHWRVIFAGNTATTRETVERYLLFRAAELTVSQGYDWFENIEQTTDKNSEVFADPGFGYGYGWRPAWRYYGAGYGGGWGGWGGYGGGGYVSTYSRYEVTAQIAMGRGARPGNRSLNAHEVMANLGPGIQRPKA
jgi:predicted small lipoprotein YifL